MHAGSVFAVARGSHSTLAGAGLEGRSGGGLATDQSAAKTRPMPMTAITAVISLPIAWQCCTRHSGSARGEQGPARYIATPSGTPGRLCQIPHVTHGIQD